MCTDAWKVTVWDQLRQRDLKLWGRFLSRANLAEAAARSGIVKLGRGPLHVFNLVWLGLCTALHGTKNFADVLVLVLKLIEDDPCAAKKAPRSASRRKGRRQAKARRGSKRSKHDPRGQDSTTVTEEAFVQARRAMPWSFWAALLCVLTDKFEAEHGEQVRWKQFRLLALDGTTIKLPAWKRLRDYFGSASNGRGRRATQARMVMLQMPFVRLPWRYELAPLRDGEKTVAARLLAELRTNDLVLMDRGFWSYGIFWQIQQQGAFFAIRKIAQVKWDVVRRLGRQDMLVRHRPSDSKKKKWAGLPAEIQLRVIHYQIRGFRPSAVVTNVLDPQAVSREEWVRLAASDAAGRVLEPGLYHRRWEIETTFRELKVTQGMEGQLRSRSPEGIRYEVAGHVLLYTLVRWLMVEAAAAGLDDPLRLSFKGALEELLDMRQTLLLATPEYAQQVLLPRLLQRIAAHRVPLRPGRHFPRPRDTKAKYKGKGRYQKPSKLAA
jgi:Transposase DDE domain